MGSGLRYTFKADMWSVGCILLFLATGKHPHHDLPNGFEVYTRVRPMAYCSCQPYITNFVQLVDDRQGPTYDLGHLSEVEAHVNEMLSFDVDKRPTATKVRYSVQLAGNASRHRTRR